MLSDIDLSNGISIKLCRSDLGIDYPLFYTSLGEHHSFELAEEKINLPLDIIGFNAKPNSWIVLELMTQINFLIANIGDYLAVRRTNKVRNGQIAIIKHEEKVLIRRIFASGEGLVLRSLDTQADLLVLPSAIDIRGTIEGLAIEKCWYKISTSEKFPSR